MAISCFSKGTEFMVFRCPPGHPESWVWAFLGGRSKPWDLSFAASRFYWLDWFQSRAQRKSTKEKGYVFTESFHKTTYPQCRVRAIQLFSMPSQVRKLQAWDWSLQEASLAALPALAYGTEATRKMHTVVGVHFRMERARAKLECLIGHDIAHRGGETHRKCSEGVIQWLLDAHSAESLALAGWVGWDLVGRW